MKLGARRACGGPEQMWSTDLTPPLSGGRIQRERYRPFNYVWDMLHIHARLDAIAHGLGGIDVTVHSFAQSVGIFHGQTQLFR